MHHGGSFGRTLRERRKERDLTQDALARTIGCAVITIKRIEADTLRPSRQIAELLAAALDIPLDERTTFIRLARSTTPAKQPPNAQPLAPPAEPDITTDLSGRTIKGYELRERIGMGGFGIVYRAQQTGVGRSVAVKIILPEYANHPEFIRRFELEAQLVARLEHPHIVPLYDYWRTAEGAFLVMRYIRGGSLKTALQGAPWSLDRTTRLLEQVGAALAFAHQTHVVHRDVKPANILLDAGGNAYLADFGIAMDLGAADSEDQTRTGFILGSPMYLAPEQIRDEPITPATDIYCLGVVLYELLAGEHPFAKAAPAERLAKQLSEPFPPLQGTRADLPPTVDTIIQRATAKLPGARYADIPGLLADWQQLVAPNEMLTVTMAAPAGSATGDADAPTSTDSHRIENPYKGLRAFGVADAGDFFGRATLTERLLERLAEESAAARFLAVVGPSGSGKSSVVRAGLIPALRRGGLPHSDSWFVVEITPGAHPLEELEAGLLRVAVNPPPSLLEQLEEDTRGLVRAIKRVLPADDTTELVLIIDQFEELFTLVADEATRAHVLDSLLAALSDPRSRLRLIITLRADFYDRPLLYPAFGELFQQRTEVVLPLTQDELTQAIMDPAARVGATFEPGVVQMLLSDAGTQAGGLPLLQYALTELFEQRSGRLLTSSAYQASGGVVGALGRRAEEIYTALDADAQAVARQLFLRLITPGEGVEDTRRRVRQSELAGDAMLVQQVIERYGRYRLLTFDRDPITREPTVEIAHEALIRTWARLHRWLESSRELVRLQQRLQTVAFEWAQSQNDPSFLANGARLTQFATLAESSDLILNQQEQGYLQASLVEDERRESTERVRLERELVLAQQAAASTQRAIVAQGMAARRLRYLAIGLALFLLVAFGLAAFALASRSDAIAQGQRAVTSAVTATVAQGQALNNAATSIANAATATSAQGQAVQSAATAVASRNRSEAQRLAAESARLFQTGGSADLIALLSIRSLRTQYTPQGDIALGNASQLNYAERILSGHRDGVWRVAFSPDGKYLLTGSFDQTARLWDVRSGTQVQNFTGHKGEIRAVAFSSDGKYIATSSADTTTRLWDVKTGQLLHELAGHTEALNSVTFSPDSEYLLTGSDDTTVRLWDVRTGTQIRMFAGHTGAVYLATFSQDGSTVLSTGADGTLRTWDAQTGSMRRVVTNPAFGYSPIAVSPDGTLVLTGDQNHVVRLWDLASGTELRQFTGHQNTVTAMMFSPDGRLALTGSLDKTARLWDIQTGAQLQIFTGHTDFLFSVAFSPDGSTVATGAKDGQARLWTLHSRAALPRFPGLLGSFSPDGKQVVTSAPGQPVQVWDSRTGAQVRTLTHEGDPGGGNVAFSADGAQILVNGGGQSVRLYDARTGAETRAFTAPAGSVFAAALSHDGSHVLISGANSATATLWDVHTGTQSLTLTHTGPVFFVGFSPDDRLLLTSSADRALHLWDAQTGTEIRAFSGHTDIVFSAAFSQDGKQILSGSLDRTVRLWDVQTGQQMGVFIGHTDGVVAVNFSHDGRTAVSASFDKTARIWNVHTGQQLRILPHSDRVISAVFSPTDSVVLTGSTDGTSRLWDVDYSTSLRALCDRLPRDFTADEQTQYDILSDGPTCPRS